ncbi:hypothetical protein Tco_0752457 [Tanacetum coccineum]|uniref:Uncharacterized protein n=1 Tax=Tanacetum coccineum TaxID=301880 RepID=A0ABQ4Z8K8_9ASTR
MLVIITTFITKGHAHAYSGSVFSEDNGPTSRLGEQWSSWPDGPFPKRLGVELSGRDIPQAARQLMSPMGTNLQATSTGQTHQFLHKQSTRLADHLRQPSTAPVSYPMNSQEHFAHGLSQNAVIQPPKDPRVATSTNVTTADGHSRINQYQTRTAAAPHPHLRTAVASHPPSPCRRSVPVGSHTQPPVGPVAGSVHPSRPGAPNIRPRAPPATAPGVFHIARKVSVLFCASESLKDGRVSHLGYF